LKRLLRIIFNVVAGVSLVLCAAMVIIALRGSSRDLFIGRSSVHPGLDPQASFAAVTSTAPPVPPRLSTLRFNEDVLLIAVIDRDIWVTRHVASYESWVRLDTGDLSGGYAGIQQLALAR